MLEAGRAERRLMHEQEVAAPEALARDRSVGLGVDGEEHAGRAVHLRHATHQHQHVAVGVGVHRAGAQRLFGQRHDVEIGVVVAGAHRAGVHDVADVTQIFAEIGRTLRLGRRRLRRRRYGGCLCRRFGLAEQPQQARLLRRRRGGWGIRCRHPCILLGRRRRTRDFGMLDVEPLIAFRRPAAETARAIRIAERQSHLEGEIGAQEIDEVGAVRSEPGLRRVLVAAEIVVQEITRGIAQHLVPDLPVQVLIGRRVEQLLDPCRKQGFVGAVPVIARLPDAACRNSDRLRLARAHGDVARHRAAIG